MRMSRAPAEADEFYVGYVGRAPRRMALAGLALSVALILVFGQQPFDRSAFEYGVAREYQGRLEAGPYPALLVPRPGAPPGLPAHSLYLLVAPGKHGAGVLVRGFDGPVRLRGSLIYREDRAMIEVLPGSISPAAVAGGWRSPPEEMGEITVTGEIADSKCYLGVMNPGRSKVHRACAARCLSGGIPPLLMAPHAMYLLAGQTGVPSAANWRTWRETRCKLAASSCVPGKPCFYGPSRASSGIESGREKNRKTRE